MQQMRFRKLRIAWSSLWGMLCLFVVFFWVRSYWLTDDLEAAPSGYVQVFASCGRMVVRFEYKTTQTRFSWVSYPTAAPMPAGVDNRIPWCDLRFWPTFARLYIAHWLLAVIAGALMAIPWLPRRFSLRGLLIATTVIATVAGSIAWVDTTF